MADNLVLPGISSEYLAQARIRHVEATEAASRCGIPESGVLLPYFDFYGEPIDDRDGPFARLRLDRPRGEQKYHQRSGTDPHAFLPPSIWDKAKNLDGPLLVVEGEKKALALAEAGFFVVGIGGFYNFRRRDHTLVPELVELLQCVRPPFFVFLGDQDVVFNSQFSHAAWTFSQLVTPSPVLVSCVPLDAPGKGVDDCRAVLGAGFEKWFADRLYLGAQIDEKSTPGSIALELLRLQTRWFTEMPPPQRDETARRLSKLAAGLKSYHLEQAGVIEMAEKLGFSRQLFKRMVKEAEQKVTLDLMAAEVGDPDKVINLGEQPGTWTRRILKIIGPRTYFFGDNLCDLAEGKFKPHSAASLVPMVDSPDCCRFVRPGQMRQFTPTQLSEKDGRLILGALRQNSESLQPVDTLAQVPALAWAPTGPQLITGYSREHRVLAAGGTMDLPPPEAAAAKILELVKDFDFVTPGDAGRALSFLLTPVLTSGGFLNSGRAPFFMIEKDQKGAGAGTFVRMLTTVFAARPCSITPDDPKAAREDVSKHLLEGASIIYFDNIRGKVMTSLPFLESLLTEPLFTCRAPYLHGTVDVSRAVMACTSNGAILSPDLADRTVKITIRKRSTGYIYHPWPEGDLIDHVAANRLPYLAAVYALVQAWAQVGRPDGSQISGFRFRQWERACAWIVEKFFGPLPLLDSDHATAQQRMANPDFDLLRALFRAVLDRGMNAAVSATDLARLGMEMGRMDADEKSGAMKVGRALSHEFPQEDAYEFAKEFRVVREDLREAGTNYEKIKTYRVSALVGTGIEVPERPPTTDVQTFDAVAASAMTSPYLRVPPMV